MKNYEEGYSPPNSIRISNNNIKNENSQSNTRWNTGWNNPNNSNNQKRNKALILEEEEVVEEIGIEGARKWSRNWKQQRYVEVCKKTDKKKEATKKRNEDARANGEQDPLFIKHRCTWEEQPEHTRAQCPGRGFNLVFWNPNKIGKPYGQVLVKDLEFKEEHYPRRLILCPSRRSIDAGATYFRDFKIKQDFRERFNTWWSNLYQTHCHKEGVYFSKELQQKMFQDKLWQKNSAEPVRNE